MGLTEANTDGPAMQPKSSIDVEEESFRSVAKKRKQQSANRSVICFVLILSVYTIAIRWPSSWTPMTLWGAVLWMTGLVTWTIARLQLGSSFTVNAEARDLVTSGIYARIQNPIYFSGASIITGISLYFGKPWGLILVLILIPIQIRRVRRERAVLEEAFGEKYTEYRSQTWF